MGYLFGLFIAILGVYFLIKVSFIWGIFVIILGILNIYFTYVDHVKKMAKRLELKEAAGETAVNSSETEAEPQKPVELTFVEEDKYGN